MSTDILIKRLMDEFAKFSENDDVNFMDCINPNENAHTRILMNLLSCNESYLKSFLEYFNLPEIDIKNCNIKGNENYIDGIIKDNKTAIIIENKVKGAVDKDRQLERYVGQIFCGDKKFLIKIENDVTNNIIKNIVDKKLDGDNETKNILNNLILNENESDLELLCLINNHNKIKNNEKIKNLLVKEKQEYEKELIERLTDETKKLIDVSENKGPEERLIKTERENIYVLYLVPNDTKDPSLYSYTSATKIFLDDNCSYDQIDSRFRKITYKEIVNWMNSYLEFPAIKQNLQASICLYTNHINYIWKEEEKDKIIERIIGYDYNKLKECQKSCEEDINSNSNVENKDYKIKNEIVKTIKNYISKKCENLLILVKDMVLKKNYEEIKGKSKHFRFLPKGIKNCIPEPKDSFKDWDRILGFEFKIENKEEYLEYLKLSFCVIQENKWDEKDIAQNKKLIENVIKKVKDSSEYESIKTYVKKYNDTRWIIEKCFELPISELIEKQDDEIKGIIENNFLKNPKFKDFEESLNIAFQNR